MRQALIIILCVFTFPIQVNARVIKTAETEMLALINNLRAEHGLSPLALNLEVTRVAKYKSEEMRKLDYKSHESPVFGNPADMLERYRIPFKLVGENIAAGTLGTEETLFTWVNSPVYLQNLLYADYREAGIGYSLNKTNGHSYWAALFVQ